MAKISIDPAKTMQCIDRMEDVARNLKELSDALDDIRGNLGYKIAGQAQIMARMRDVSGQIVREETAVRSMRDGLEQIIQQYQRTEDANLGRISIDASTAGDTGDSAYPTDEASLMNYIQTHKFQNVQEVLDLIFRLVELCKNNFNSGSRE